MIDDRIFIFYVVFSSLPDLLLLLWLMEFATMSSLTKLIGEIESGSLVGKSGCWDDPVYLRVWCRGFKHATVALNSPSNHLIKQIKYVMFKKTVRKNLFFWKER